MKLSELKNYLNAVSSVNFIQSNGNAIPKHFHLTEAGLVRKHFIDCGGTVREEKFINFQLWTSKDIDHRIEAGKLLKIISIYEKLFGSEDLEVEVEYQIETIGKYGLDFKDETFILTAKYTDCLAKDNCGASKEKQKLALTELQTQKACCTVDSECC